LKEEIKMKIYMILLVLCLMSGLFYATEMVNEDKPLKGEYIFPKEEIWSINEAGDTPFALVVTVLISDSGHVFCRDLKNKEYYAFDPYGKFISKFGLPGEGPAEVKNSGSADLSVFKDKVIVGDSDKLLYFDQRGKFLTSIRYFGPDNIFISETELIAAPQSILRTPSGKAKMKYVNLKTGEEKEILDFTMFKSGAINQGNLSAAAVIPTITPVMVVGYHQEKIYYGLNNDYKIHVTNLEGKDLGHFSLIRKKKKVSLKEREDYMLALVKGLAPEELGRRLAKTLPDTETYFSDIYSYDKLLYVFRSHFPPGAQQQIDIFTSEGKYLYKAFVKVGEGNTIVANPVFHKDHLYLAYEDEEGEVYVKKYATTMPSQ
jgi:hypothetical protein